MPWHRGFSLCCCLLYPVLFVHRHLRKLENDGAGGGYVGHVLFKLVFFGCSTGKKSSNLMLVDYLFHIWVIVSLFIGVSAGYKLQEVAVRRGRAAGVGAARQLHEHIRGLSLKLKSTSRKTTCRFFTAYFNERGTPVSCSIATSARRSRGQTGLPA